MQIYSMWGLSFWVLVTLTQYNIYQVYSCTMKILLFHFYSSWIEFYQMYGFIPKCEEKSLLLKTLHTLNRTWKSQAGIDLKASFQRTSFHSTRRCYAIIQGRKIYHSSYQDVRSTNHNNDNACQEILNGAITTHISANSKLIKLLEGNSCLALKPSQMRWLVWMWKQKIQLVLPFSKSASFLAVY